MRPGTSVQIQIENPVGPIEKLINGKTAKVRRPEPYSNIEPGQLVVRLEPVGADFQQPFDAKVKPTELTVV